ncbi:MAG: hypothetical protein JNM34_09365 [Chthonomonadaceae bacterium]|nr:hypothetical protein [Chthonomonadaceae bacterium]
MSVKQIRSVRPSRHDGQTLIIAIIILGLLLILGFAFAGIIYRNITDTSRGAQRNLATELARAGADFSHYQLRYSGLGADWRPGPTPPESEPNAANITKDPDALYLRPGDPTLPFSSEGRLANVPDYGGPDGYGPYARMFFDRGRTLVRVRYAPFSYDAYANPNGQLREPGKARQYITIEVVGRPGKLKTGTRVDPSLQLKESVKFRNFTDIVDKTSNISKMKALDNAVVNSRKLIAFSSIGIIEHLRYITDKSKGARAAEIGWPNSTTTGQNRPTPFDQASAGGSYGDGQAPFNGINDAPPVQGRVIYGQSPSEPNPGRANNWQSTPGLGSLYCNTALKVYGLNNVNVNASLGESWDVAGQVSAANSLSTINISRTRYDRAQDLWVSDVTVNGTNFNSTVNNPVPLTGPALDSNQSSFLTVAAAFRDGNVAADPDGFPRGIPRKEPPSILTLDPQNRQDRYLLITRESGRSIGNRNTGQFGLGRGPYIDSPERGNTDSEDERAVSGAVKALPTDWLNPNNSNSQGWKGPYYIPIAAYLRLLPDGFEVTRDSRSTSAFWIDQNGRRTNQSTCRYRLRTVEFPANSGKFIAMILNSISNPTEVGKPGLSLSDAEYRQFGQPFNGVVYFEGDVRVRGVIPTDQQISVVSKGSIYIDGSVVKGVTDETGTTLSRPSRSAIMLAARDYVCVNTTMFFGPAAGEAVEAKNENAVPDTPNPLELKIDNPSLSLEAQFLLDPNTPQALGGNPNNPSTWRPFANNYTSSGSGAAMACQLFVDSSADDNGPSFVSLDIAPMSYALASGWGGYLFPRDLVFGALQPVRFNAASEFFTGNGPIPVYGLGNSTLNAYPKFESIEFPLVLPTFNYTNRRLVPPNANLGDYNLAVQDPTRIRIRMNGIGNAPTKNFLASKTAMAPHDIRIEAAMYAEEGSFFVIPGNWFNTNNQDTRRSWMDRSANSVYSGMNDSEANLRRFELFGHTPAVPFYAEPLDVRVSIVGAISENMPAPISAQSEWLKKWGWIPRQIGSTGLRIPNSHTSGLNPDTTPALPNLTMSYDPVFANGSVYDGSNNLTLPLRADENGWVLAPMPRLPVSPTLAYFGEVNP